MNSGETKKTFYPGQWGGKAIEEEDCGHGACSRLPLWHLLYPQFDENGFLNFFFLQLFDQVTFDYLRFTGTFVVAFSPFTLAYTLSRTRINFILYLS